MQDYYDVVIVGAGIAGLECARNFCNSGLSVLVVEKNSSIGGKVCAGGITFRDLEYIPKNILNYPFRKVLVRYKNKTLLFPGQEGFISTIDRKKLSRCQLNHLKKFGNIEILTGVSARGIMSNTFIVLSSGEKIEFKFLIGADGATSVVRRYLKLPTNKLEIAFHYLIPKKFKNFEGYLDAKLFGTGFYGYFHIKISLLLVVVAI